MLAPSLLLLAWIGTAFAQNPQFISTKVCTTKYGSTSRARVPTSTTHAPSTRKSTIMRTTTLTSTIRSAPFTTIVNTTTTTVPNVVTETGSDVVTLITTLTSTSTEVTTSTSTSTLTTTSTTTTEGTTTSPAPAGFTAIGLQADYHQKRAEGHFRHIRRATKTKKASLPLATAKAAANLHPTAVTCGLTTTRVTTVVKTARKTVTVDRSTVTTTRTITSTDASVSTKTVGPSTTTVTSFGEDATQTITTTRTTTEIESATVTAFAALSTAYAQCVDVNRVNEAYSHTPIQGVSFDPSFSVSSEVLTDDTTDGLECCNICATTPNCAGFAQKPDGTCYVIKSTTCAGSQTFGDAFHYYGGQDIVQADGTGAQYVVGNGQCGRLAAISGPNGNL